MPVTAVGSRPHAEQWAGRHWWPGRISGRRAVGGTGAHVYADGTPSGGRWPAALWQIGTRRALRTRRVLRALLADARAAALPSRVRHQLPHVRRQAIRRATQKPQQQQLYQCRVWRRRHRFGSTSKQQRTRVRLCASLE